MDWTQHLARRTQRLQPSAIREILKLTQRSEVISFAGGLPAPALFPVEALRRACDTVLGHHGSEALQYGTTEGHLPLRRWVASRLPGATSERVQIVSGSQQALDLVAKVLLDPGDTVAVGAPTYMGALRAFDAYEPRYLTIESDDEGLVPESLERVLSERPKLLYVIPNFDNPAGVTLGLARRRRLLELAERYDVPIFEDDPYGDLRFEGDALPSLYELAPERVVYAGTFSKIVVPGFRLAWLVAAPELLTPIVRAKQAADLHTATFTQMVAVELTRDGFMDTQVERVQGHYRTQRDLMLSALERHFPAEVRWSRPQGGMFLWVTLPVGCNATELALEAVREGVAFVPGAPFFANGGGENTLRLSYSVASPEQIDTGMARLGRVLEGAIAQPAG